MHGTEMFKAFLNRWHATTAATCPPVFEASLLRKVNGGGDRKIRQFTTITIATKYTYIFPNISLCYLYLITRIVLPIYYYL